MNRVLLVGSNESETYLVRQLLENGERQAFSVEWVTTLEAARTALEQRHFEVCLVGAQVGARNGLDLVTERLQGDPPFIALFSHESSHDAGHDASEMAREMESAAVAAGAMDFLLQSELSAVRLERSIRFAMERAKREKGLELANRRSHLLAEAVNNLTEGLVITDARQPDNPIIFSNAAFSAMTGYTSAEIMGRNCRFLQGEKSQAQEIEAMSQAIQARRPFSGVILNYRKDGTPFWNSVKLTPVFDERGQIANFVGLQSDITARKRDEVSLRESEANLRAAQSLARMGSWELDLADREDLSSNALRWSDEVVRIFGFEAGEIEVSTHRFFEAVHPDDRELLKEAMARAVEDGQPYSIDHRVVWPDGTEHVVHEQANLICDEITGAPCKMVGTVQDITERKRAEALLKFQKTLLEAQSETSLDGILVVSQDRKILSYNQRFQGMWNIPQTMVEDGQDAPVLKTVLNQVANPQGFSERVAHLYAHCTEQSHDEILLLDGRIFDRYSAPITSAEGLYYGRVWYFRDITERKRTENALRETEARSQAVIHNALDCIITIDHQSRILEFNPAAEATFGYTRAQALGQDLNALIVPPELHQAHSQGIAHFLVTGEGPVLGKRIEVPAIRKDGTRITVELAVSVLANSQPALFTAYLRDITESKQSENALRAIEERFQSIVSNVPGMVYQLVIDPDGAMQWPLISEGCRDIYDAGPEALRDNPDWITRCIYPEDLGDFLSSLEASARNLTPWAWEGRYRLITGPSAGKTRWIQGASRPQRLDGGGTLWNGVIMDVTARKEAETERDRFFTMSLDMLGIAGFDGHFKRLNPAFSQVLGYSEAELLSKPFLDWVIPEDRVRTFEAFENLARDGFLVDFENRYQCSDSALRWLEWQAVALPEAGLIYAAARDVTERKEVEKTLLRMRDELESRVEERTAELEASNAQLQIQIDEREQAERETRIRALQQESVAELGQRALLGGEMDALLQGAASLVTTTLEVDFSSILELNPDQSHFLKRAVNGANALDASCGHVAMGRVSLPGYTLEIGEPVVVTALSQEKRFRPATFLLHQGIESAVCVMIGSALEPFGVLIVGSRTPRAFTSNDVTYLQSAANVLATALSRNRTESEIRDLNDELRQINKKLHSENIERQMALGALRDTAEILNDAKVEAERAREDAELANRAKSEFLSRMSHELRTPLNAILGFGQILDRQELTPLQSESVGYILKGGHHLLSLINEVLDIARVESGHIELSVEALALDDVVNESCALVQPLADQDGISLIPHPPGAAPFYVHADRQRLKQVLINLLSNAIKYNRKGGQVQVAIFPAEDGQIRLHVTDSGWGLEAQEIQKLFTPFERLRAADSAVEGTGLGLVLSKRLVIAMNGTIGVESELGRGSTFWLQLPIAESPLQALVESPHSPVFALRSGFETTCKVLSIEDNLSNTRLLEAILKNRSDINLITAIQGSVGLDLAHQHQPDLILLDLHLPGLPGLEVLKELQRAENTKDIPVIVVSADATPTQIERLLASGARRYLTKPLNIEEFLWALDETLRPQTSQTQTSQTQTSQPQPFQPPHFQTHPPQGGG